MGERGAQICARGLLLGLGEVALDFFGGFSALFFLLFFSFFSVSPLAARSQQIGHRSG